MQCGIVLLMILCAPYLGLKYRHRVFGIAAGFGLLAAIDLMAVATVGRIGLSSSTAAFFSIARMVAFNFAAGLWTVYFLRTEPARGPAMQHSPSERWNFAMATATNPQSSGPSLPLIIGVVDRAFEKIGIHDRRGSGPNRSDQ